MTRRFQGGMQDRFRLVDLVEGRRHGFGLRGILPSGGQQEPPPAPPRDDPAEPPPIGEPPRPIPVPPSPGAPPMQL